MARPLRRRSEQAEGRLPTREPVCADEVEGGEGGDCVLAEPPTIRPSRRRSPAPRFLATRVLRRRLNAARSILKGWHSRCGQAFRTLREHSTIRGLRLHQLGVSADSTDGAVLEKCNSVGERDSGWAMHDEQRRCGRQDATQRLLYQGLGMYVEGGQGVVQDQYRWLADDCSS